MNVVGQPTGSNLLPKILREATRKIATMPLGDQLLARNCDGRSSGPSHCDTRNCNARNSSARCETIEQYPTRGGGGRKEEGERVMPHAGCAARAVLVLRASMHGAGIEPAGPLRGTLRASARCLLTAREPARGGCRQGGNIAIIVTNAPHAELTPDPGLAQPLGLLRCTMRRTC